MRISIKQAKIFGEQTEAKSEVKLTEEGIQYRKLQFETLEKTTIEIKNIEEKKIEISKLTKFEKVFEKIKLRKHEEEKRELIMQTMNRVDHIFNGKMRKEREIVDNIMDTFLKEKVKNYPMIIRSMIDIVHSAYQRALEGGERRSLREARQVQQTDQITGMPIGYPQQKKKSIFKPWTWGG